MTHGRVSLLLAIVAILVIVAAAGWAARPQTVTDALRVERISAELRCPVCQGLSVQDSPSETAREMRDLVTTRISQGRSDEEVREEFRRAYGDWVFLAPPLAGPRGLVWLLPLLLVIGGGAVAFTQVRRSRACPPGDDAVPAVDPDDLRRLRERVAAGDTLE